MLSTPRSNRSIFGKRTLSIADRTAMLPVYEEEISIKSTPRKTRNLINKRMSESKDGAKQRYLNEKNLMIIDPTRPFHAIGDSERFEIKSRVSQTSKHSQKPTSIRLPSIQGDHKNAQITSDLLS